MVDTGLKYTNGITLSPDQTLLYVADYRSHWIYSYVIKPDGTLQSKARFYWILVPDTGDQANSDGMHVDVDGRLYVATSMGIQVCDQAGRVQCIIPHQTSGCRILRLGEHFDTLFATCGDKVYKPKDESEGRPGVGQACEARQRRAVRTRRQWREAQEQGGPPILRPAAFRAAALAALPTGGKASGFPGCRCSLICAATPREAKPQQTIC